MSADNLAIRRENVCLDKLTLLKSSIFYKRIQIHQSNMASTVCTLLTGYISPENNHSWLALTATWLWFNKRQRSPDF